MKRGLSTQVVETNPRPSNCGNLKTEALAILSDEGPKPATTQRPPSTDALYWKSPQETACKEIGVHNSYKSGHVEDCVSRRRITPSRRPRKSGKVSLTGVLVYHIPYSSSPTGRLYSVILILFPLSFPDVLLPASSPSVLALTLSALLLASIQTINSEYVAGITRISLSTVNV